MAHEDLKAKLEEVDLNVQEVQTKLTQYFDLAVAQAAALRAEITRLEGLVDSPEDLAALSAIATKLEQGVQTVETALDTKLAE